jgi:TP901 family phage tail tape measure protein
MIDEIIIKARLDTKQAEQEFDELKKKGNSTISDIEKNEVKLKVDLDTKQAEAKVNNLNKSSGLLGNITQKAKEGFQGLGSSLAGVLNPMTAIAGAGVAIVGTFFKMIDVNKKFQQSLAELQSITGVTTQDLQFYRNQAQEIARDKTLSSSLEETVNAFKLVGSAKPDLLQNKEALAEVTKQAILLSKASGDTLESSVNSLTGTLNQFNFGAEEAGRVIDVLAAGSKAGAVAIPDLSAGLEKFGAVAKANNVTVEQAVALQETLGDKQIQGAEAGTQLRNIILKLANAGKGYVNGQFDINAALEQTRNEFQNIQDPVKRSQELTKLFGLESVTAGQILLDSTDKFKQYTAAVGEQGVALSQAQTNTNTFDGALTRLSNSFEALLSGGGNLLNIFTPLVDVIAEALPSIGNFFTQLGTAISTFFSESQYVQKVGELFSALFNTVKEVSIGIYNALVEIGSAFGLGQDGASNFAKVFDYLLTNVRIAIDGLILLITNFKDVLVGAFQIIALQVKSFVSFWKAIFAGDFRGALNVVISYFDGLANIVTKTFDKVKLNVINAILGITETVRPILESLGVDVNGLTKNLKALQAELGKKLQSTAKITTVTDKKNLSTTAASTAITTTTTDVAATEGEEKKANDAAKKRYAEAVKNEKDANDKIIKERNRLIDALDKPQEAKKAEIDTLTARGASKEEIAKANEELLQLEIDYANKVNIIRSNENQKLTAKFKENIDARDKEIVASFEENKKISENELKLQNEKIKNAIAASQIVDDSTLKELQAKKQLLSETETLNDKEKEDKEKQLLEIEALILQSQNRILQSKIDAAIKAGAAENGELVKGLQEQLKANEELIDKNQKDINKNTKKNQDKADKERQDRLKEAVNELIDFAQNGILLQIGINPADVNKVKGTLENLKKTLEKEGATPGEKAAAAAQAAGAVAQTVSNTLFAADTKRREEELAALQVQQEEELRLAGDNEQKKDLIRQKYALKEKDIKRKQAEADKRKAIFDAIINTAVAVVTGFVKGGPILAAIAAALGAAQIALISAQPIPKFAKGGAVPSSDINGMISGKPHAAGGVLIEAEGNEFITRRSQAMKGDNLGLLEAINMSDSERDAYINRHYVMPALQAKESEAAKSYRSSIIEAENNLIARVSSSTLKSIDRRLVETNQSIKGLAKKDYTW